MSKDPAFLFYPGDYLRDTQNLSEKTQVAYDRIMCEHMRNICEDMNKIYLSKKQINFFTKRLNEDEKDELLFVLKEINEGYQIEWVAESIAKRKAYSNSRRENRKKGSKKTSKSYDKHMENENEIENEDKSIVIEFPYKKGFEEPLKEWFEYKESRNEPYNSQMGKRKFYNELLSLSGGDPKKAKKIVDKSIANNYKGVIEPKGETNNQSDNKLPSRRIL